VESGGKFTVTQGMTNPKVLLLSVNYLGIVTASLGLLLFDALQDDANWCAAARRRNARRRYACTDSSS